MGLVARSARSDSQHGGGFRSKGTPTGQGSSASAWPESTALRLSMALAQGRHSGANKGCYEVTMLAAKVYSVLEERYCEKLPRLLLLITAEGKAYIADSGFGIASYQTWQPIGLVSGKDQPQSPGIFRLAEDNAAWYFGKIKRKPYTTNRILSHLGKRDYRKIYSFTFEPHTIEDFSYANKYHHNSPESMLTKNSICCLWTLEGSSTLTGWTLTTVIFNYKDDTDLVTSTTVKGKDIEKILREKFNIVLERKFVPCSSKDVALLD
ncbi:arylamine N-acetyltransferase, pineal gland isozyme NAT-10-like [Tachyglossus aculeatus]|uniref:arylamine N-acetyltransferase, pineal gland isozyme NAT-10-like n=1 Tax=Tachyglossus aculeatus TaxID=9261 RepID=UPI0018F61860|nr:arylamine N-acetyltransferase, pineal gland isozyme NAT-10-like [Tachyglossus aculeatus]